MKKVMKLLKISIILCAGLVILTGCGNKDEDNKTKNNKNENVAERTNSSVEENKVSNVAKNTTTNTTNKNTTNDNKIIAKEVDKTPVDVKDNNSYYFIVKGKKYSAGDKISSLSESGFHLNKAGSEKELQKYGYLIGGGAVLNSDNKTVFNITPFNNTNSTIKAADASIGSFSLDKSSYEMLDGDIEIVNGITFGTSIEDVKTIFGEPTKITEATEYIGPTYEYNVTGEYKSFTFRSDKEGKITSIRWQNYVVSK